MTTYTLGWIALLLTITCGKCARVLVNAHMDQIEEEALDEGMQMSKKVGRAAVTEESQKGPIVESLNIGTKKAYFATHSDTLRDRVQSMSPVRSMSPVHHLKRNRKFNLSKKFSNQVYVSDRENTDPQEHIVSMPDRYVNSQEKCSSNKTKSWGLVRISSPKPLTNWNIIAGGDYIYNDNAGDGVNVYILDSGFDVNLDEFKPRAEEGKDFAGDTVMDKSRCYGHGSLVAGILGSNTFGVAKKAHLINVRVIDCTGIVMQDNVVKALQWVIQKHKIDKKKSVINLSIAFGKDSMPPGNKLEEAVKQAIAAGIHVVTSAGNFDKDGCQFYPGAYAKSSSVINVMASDIRDSRYSTSNYGPCGTIFAPGRDIRTLAPDGKMTQDSGTSLAAPFVAGEVAVLLSTETGDIKPENMKRKIENMALRAIKPLADRTTDRLLHNPCN